MSNKRLVGIASVLCILGASDAMAAGSSSQAGKEFDRGTSAAARGDYLDAAAAFMRAYKLAPHAAPLYNAALAWEAAGDRARAADAYATSIEMGGLGDGQARDAHRRLEALRANLGRLDVVAPPGTTISVAHAERVKTPAHIYLERGDHELRAWLPEGRTELRQVVVGPTPVEVRIDVVAPTPSGPRPAVATTSSVASPGEGNALRTWGWVALGAGVAVGGLTAYLGVQALDAKGEYYDSARTNRDAYDRAGSYRTWTNVALGGSIILAGAGVLLLVRAPSGSTVSRPASHESARVWLSSGPGALVVSGSF